MNQSSTLNNPGEYLDFLRAASSGSVKDAGQTTLDGVQTTHYQATIDETVKGHSISTAVTENFSDYGSQPSPTVPSAAQTTNLLSLLHHLKQQQGATGAQGSSTA